ncbi:DUF551 domain-containing protein [Escherichia coli]|uniref:DUF551 domain-containing protein n=2 Tax=Escherichia coli TaxID=562 RepID=A0A8S7QRU8_ECOLX|nr:DUF551 domain-containing protein [Escherichia coli]EFH0042196.1 DUF551 domain-containing protein [Escherichia coli]MDL6022028.1 DUF551 domain-containing protein [Escherichia coli]MDM6789805.1 DUF551 domain-containing protein [Escherichia coli]MDM6808654.1 DUF551 domain-containing protein [Escherichia coli]MDW3302786.1 DUF551 domain-containing protein [Escherichia coli]
MTTITKERLLTIRQWRETYGPGSNVVLPAEEAEELARIALASLEAEPVAWMRDDADGREYNARNEFSGGGGGVPLYATPPVPVVPEEKPMPNPLSMYAVDAVAAIAEVRGWNACRAAMLHSAEPASNHEELPLDYLQGQKDGLEWAAQLAEANHPQTGDWLYDDPLELAKAIRKGPDMPEFDGPTPVTPDGWISCSERMPEETGDIIVVSDGIVMSGISYSRRDGFYIAALEYDDDEPIGGVTHWMLLPEPPQEVK